MTKNAKKNKKKTKKQTITPTPKEDIQLSVGKLGSILVQFIFYNLHNKSHAVNHTVTPAHAATSIERSHFSCTVINNS